nr:MAG TPA: hypothetical protein [Caudoviricetes sp.]DAP84148.1 MAG TPA: hypothetical protein [Caudoviricetes sp.]
MLINTEYCIFAMCYTNNTPQRYEKGVINKNFN